jgi:hypothetical protein
MSIFTPGKGPGQLGPAQLRWPPSPTAAQAKALYWVGGTGNWSDANHWAPTSGGVGNNSGIPDIFTNAIFDQNSSTSGNYTVTQDVVEAVCLDWTFAAAPASGGTVTFTGSQNLNPAGNVTLLAGMTYSHSAQVRMTAGPATTKYLRTNGVVISSQWTFSNGGNTTYVLLDNLTLSSSLLRLISGSFDPNGNSVTITATSQSLIGSFTFFNLSLTPGATKVASCTLANNIVVTNLLTIAGNSAVNRHFISSSVIGVTRTITAASASLSNVDFQDITVVHSALSLPGTTGANASTPNAVANQITGDIDIRAFIKATYSTWATTVLVGKDDTNTSRGFSFQTTSTGGPGRLRFLYTNDGATSAGHFGDSTASVNTALTDNVAGWVRATYATSTGVITFYTSSDGVTWTQLGATVTITAGTIFNTNVVVSLGAASTGTFPFTGSVYRARIFNGINGTLVVDSNPAIVAAGSTTFTGSGTGETWTVNGTASIVADPLTGTSVGDAAGNSGITFTPAVTRFWVGNGGNWSDTNHWAASTGAAGGQSVPIPQDTVTFDVNSISVGSQVITMDMPRAGKDISFATITNSPTLTGAASTAVVIYGSWTMGTGMGAWTTGAFQGFGMDGRGNHTFTTAGKTIGMLPAFEGFGGTYTLQDSFTTSRGLQHTAGTLNTNGQAVTSQFYNSFGGLTRALILGTTTWTLTGDDLTAPNPVWNNAGATVSCGTSTILINGSSANNKTFAGFSQVYNNVRWTGTGTGAVGVTSGNNTFNEFRVDTPVPVKMIAGTTTSAATWKLFGRGMQPTDVAYGYVTTLANSSFSTPSALANQITSDLDIRVKAQFNTWVPSPNLVDLLDKWGITSGQFCYLFRLNANGTLQLSWTPDGVNPLNIASTVATGLAAGSTSWVRATLQVNNGSSGNTVTFYTSPDGITWNQLGAPVITAGVTSIFSGSSILQVNGRDTVGDGNGEFKVYRAQIFAGINGTLKADFNPALYVSGSTFTAATTEVWTLNTNAAIAYTNQLGFVSTTASTYTLAKLFGGSVETRYVSFSRATGSPVSTFNSHFGLDSNNNSNVTFVSPRYWVGGSGNWSDATNHWATVSGGAPNVANTPSTATDVEFDGNSNATAYTLTIDGTPSCNELSFGAGPATSGTVTVAGTNNLTIAGGYTLLSGMVLSWTGVPTFTSTSGVKLLTNNTATPIGNGSAIIFNGVGGTWQLQDAWAVTSSNLQLTNGTFDPNDQTVTMSRFLGGAITGPFTFYNLTINGVGGTKTAGYTFSSGMTITNNLVLAGSGPTDRLLIQSTVAGSQRLISALNTTLQYIDFEDIALYSNYLNLNATSGNTATTPDSVANSITGDIDIRAYIDAWDASAATAKTLISKSLTSQTNRTWVWRTASGSTINIEFIWKEVGGTTRVVAFGNVVSQLQTPGWVRVTLVVNNGAGGHVVTLYKSTDNVNWTQVGTPQNAGAFTTNIIDSAAPVRIGADDENPATTAWQGKVYRVRVYSGINGTLINNFNASLVAPGSTSLTAATGEVWTVNGTASIVNTPATGTSLGDVLGNAGITFTAPVNRFWVGNAGNWSDTNHWAATTGAAGGQTVPLAQDTVSFDANSFSIAAQTVNQDMARMGKDISFAGVTNAPILAMGVAGTMCGSLTLGTGMTTSGAQFIQLAGRSVHTITSNGVAINSGLAFNSNGTYVLGDPLTITYSVPAGGSNRIFFNNGTAGGVFHTNGFNMTIPALAAGSVGGTTINLSSSVVTLTGIDSGGGTWIISSAGANTVNPGNSIIKLTDSTGSTKTFAGGNKNYNVVWFSGTGNGPFIITGNNTIAELKADTPPHAIQLTNLSTQTVTKWSVNGIPQTGSDYKFLYVGTAGGSQTATTPDSVANSVTGDLDLRARFVIENYNPGARVIFASKRASAPTSGEFDFRIETDGTLALTWYSGGGVAQVGSSSVTLASAGLSTGTPVWVRVTRQNNNAGNFQVIFYYSTDGAAPVSWTQLGAAFNGVGVANVGDSASVFAVGGSQSGNSFPMRLLDVQLLNGIAGSVVARMNANDYSSGQTWTSSTGEVWTLADNTAVIMTTNKMYVSPSTTGATASLTKTGASVKASYVVFRKITGNPVSTWNADATSFDFTGNSQITFLGGKFWVGGSGNWSDATNHWATSSGGTPNVANTTTATDDVYFDLNSNATAYTVTVDTTSLMNDLRIDGAPATSGTVTLAGSSQMTVSGNWQLLSGMTYTHSGALVLNATSGIKTMTSKGVLVISSITFNGIGGTWQLQDPFFSAPGNGVSFTLTNGIFDTNKQLVTLSGTSACALGGSGLVFQSLTRSGNTGFATATWQMRANVTVTDNLTITGNTQAQRFLMNTQTLGTPFTMSVNGTALTNADFQDINMARTYLSLPGIAGNAASTPNAAANQITGDIDVRVQLQHDNWTGANAPNDKYLISKANGVSQQSWLFGINNGQIFVYVSLDGTNWDGGGIKLSGTSLGYSNGSEHYVRFTRNASSGTVQFFKSDDGVTWTQVGSNIAGTPGALFNSSTSVVVGGWQPAFLVGTNNSCKILRAQVYNGLNGTLSVDFCAAKGTVGGTTLTGTTGETWTINQSGGTTAQLAALSVSGTSLGDALGNSGLTFTTSTTRFWVGGTGNWSDPNHWSTTTGGSIGASVPLSQDDVVFDANSVTSGSQTITMDEPRAGRNISFTTIANAPTLISANSLTVNVFGSWTMGSGLGSWLNGSSSTLQMSARSAVTFSCAGKSNSMTLVVGTIGGSLTFLDAYQSSRIQHFAGTLITNNNAISSIYYQNSGTYAKALTLGSSTWTITGDDASGGTSAWQMAAPAQTTVTPGTSTILFTSTSANTKTFNGGAKTYNNLQFAGIGATNAYIIGAGNTFNSIISYHEPKTIQFTASSTTVVSSLNILGYQATPTTLGSTTPGTAWTLSAPSGTVKVISTTVQDSTATGGATFKAMGAAAGATLLLTGNTGWTNTPDEGSTVTLDFTGVPPYYSGLYTLSRNYVTLDFTLAGYNYNGLYPLIRISSLQNPSGLYYMIALNIFLKNAWPTGLYAGPLYSPIGGTDQSKVPIKTVNIAFNPTDLKVFTLSPNITRYGQIFGLH